MFVQHPQQNVGNVRRFEFAPDWPGRPVDEMLEEPWIDDLTSDSILGGNICSLSAVSTCLDALPRSCTTFDMTYSDCDGVWTVDTSDVNHVRAGEIIFTVEQMDQLCPWNMRIQVLQQPQMTDYVL